MLVGAARLSGDCMAGPMCRPDLTPRGCWLGEPGFLGTERCHLHCRPPPGNAYVLGLNTLLSLSAMALPPDQGTCDVSFCDWAVIERPAGSITVRRGGSRVFIE